MTELTIRKVLQLSSQICILSFLFILNHKSHAFTTTTTISRGNSFVTSSSTIIGHHRFIHSELYNNIQAESSSSSDSKETPLLSQENTMTTKTRSKNEKSIIKNFRKAYGLDKIYRCANTDPLGDNDSNEVHLNSSLEVDTPEYMLLNKAGLILDLRSDSERNETLAQSWMNSAPGGTFFTKYFTRKNNDKQTSSSNKYIVEDASKRFVYRIDLLSPTRLFNYLSQNWLTTSIQKAQYTFNVAFDTEKLHFQRIKILNEKGLAGIYQSMLETSGEELFNALKAITIYLEYHCEDDHNDSMVVVHCVHGKDRTGLVIMLCQSILEIDEKDVIEDYHKSESLIQKRENRKEVVEGTLNRDFFSKSPKKVMEHTIQFIKLRYDGSVFNYLDSIGFDSSWRSRFIYASVSGSSNEHRLQSKL